MLYHLFVGRAIVDDWLLIGLHRRPQILSKRRIRLLKENQLILRNMCAQMCPRFSPRTDCNNEQTAPSTKSLLSRGEFDMFRDLFLPLLRLGHSFPIPTYSPHLLKLSPVTCSPSRLRNLCFMVKQKFRTGHTLS